MRSRGKANKLLMIGLDGLMKEPIEKFMAEGIMPAVAGLMRRGGWSKAIPSMPVDTPTNWTTIAMGTDTARHGKTSFFIHFPGRGLDDYDLEESWLSTHRQAETLWEAAEPQGKGAIVINYPVAWPPTIKRGIVVGGRGIFGHPEMQIGGMVQWSQTPRKGETPIRFSPARRWKGLPGSKKPALEARIAIGEGGEKLGWSDAGQRRLGRGKDARTTGASHFDLAMIATGASGYDKVLFCTGKDASAPLAALAPGAWTEWLYGKFGKEPRRAAFRYKLIRLSPDGKELTLYRTPNVSLRGFAHPEKLCDEIVRALGPFVKGLDVTYNPLYWGTARPRASTSRWGSRSTSSSRTTSGRPSPGTSSSRRSSSRITSTTTICGRSNPRCPAMTRRRQGPPGRSIDTRTGRRTGTSPRSSRAARTTIRPSRS